MKTEICYHFYKTKIALSNPEYLYFPTVQLQIHSIQDPPPKTPLWFPPPYCSQSNFWHWFFACLILQSYLLLCNPNICKHGHELDPHGFTWMHVWQSRKIWSSLEETVSHLCSHTAMDPWGTHSRKGPECCTASSVKCYNPSGTPQTPPCLSRYGSF